MKKSEIIALSAIVVGSFLTGVVWAPAISEPSKLKDVLEASSFIATILACGVAASALASWKHQFRYTERYARLATLKDAATDLHLYRGYLLAIGRACDTMLRGDLVEPELAKEIDDRRTTLLDTFAAYRKSWTSAVGFLTLAEESSYSGAPEVFLSLFMARSKEIYAAAEEALNSGCHKGYHEVFKASDTEAKELYARTVSFLDSLLSEKL
ncbi:hypothetical protein GPJ81_14160 [Pseudomonas alkylphenolica]|uniref:DUF4760 domain-containing protein n=1 Tax=Pseudomonas alkylphenolica TaxID=237609 RepID=A0A6I6GXQ7_9PSED|nr:hypothetical protein [Pseudomonas alkylphenolica]QGW77779.1 hypothetical protein GPJ81_14160 [Pseudomonas alkylphenolica]